MVTFIIIDNYYIHVYWRVTQSYAMIGIRIIILFLHKIIYQQLREFIFDKWCYQN